MATVRTGCRIHVGFQNLSLAHERLYGGIGISLVNPTTTVSATRADDIHCDHPLAAEYAARATEHLSVPGASVALERRLPRHVGLGSGTQLALGVYAAIARAYGQEADVYSAAPILGRGGRSGIGVASFESGGLLVDAGHPTARFTTDRPPDGEWSVPPAVVSQRLPDDWRVVLAIPEAQRGRHGDQEAATMASIVESAAPEIADEIATTLTRRLLPAAVSGDAVTFGNAISDIERLNGSWYADEQGGVFRPPIGDIVDRLSAAPSIYGAGQSSWGPTVYGLTDGDGTDDAIAAAEAALESAGLDGDVIVTKIADAGVLCG